jgi:transcriptional regulator GlxA family with amidase domain
MDQRLEAAIAFMKANLHRKLTPAEIAEHVHLSVARVRQLFKIETGTSLARYLRSLRLKQAKHLFETTSLSAKEVASRVGIAGISHFGREFKRAYRVTPARYAARYRRTTHKP